MQRKSSWGAVWGRPGALNLGFLSRLGCGSLLQGPGLHAREEEEASTVCTHHLSCPGGEDNNYWERFRKKNHYQITTACKSWRVERKTRTGSLQDRAAAGVAPRRAAVADLEGKTSATHLCEAHL